MQRMMEDPFLKKRLEYSSEKASDYSTVFLPWGPTWTAKRIRKLMMTKDIVLNSEWSEAYNNRGYHTHPCFIGTLEEVIQDCCGHCPRVPASVDRESLECFVSGPLSFIVDDPGRQTIGSFHPITDGDWCDGAYLSKDAEQLMQAANSNDVDAIRELVKGGVSVNTTDSLGRTALHIAALSNQRAAAEALLELGADATVHMKDGRNIIHIAAEYGYLELLQLFLQKLKLEKKGEEGEEGEKEENEESEENEEESGEEEVENEEEEEDEEENEEEGDEEEEEDEEENEEEGDEEEQESDNDNEHSDNSMEEETHVVPTDVQHESDLRWKDNLFYRGEEELKRRRVFSSNLMQLVYGSNEPVDEETDVGKMSEEESDDDFFRPKKENAAVSEEVKQQRLLEELDSEKLDILPAVKHVGVCGCGEG